MPKIEVLSKMFIFFAVKKKQKQEKVHNNEESSLANVKIVGHINVVC